MTPRRVAPPPGVCPGGGSTVASVGAAGRLIHRRRGSHQRRPQKQAIDYRLSAPSGARTPPLPESAERRAATRSSHRRRRDSLGSSETPDSAGSRKSTQIPHCSAKHADGLRRTSITYG